MSQIVIFWFKLDSTVKRSNSKLYEFDLGWPIWLIHHKSNSWLNPWLAIYGILHLGKGFKPNFYCFFSLFCLMEVFSTCWCEGTVTKSSTKRLLGRVNSDRFLSGLWTHLTDENQDYHHIIDDTYSLWNFEDLLKYCNI